MRARIDSLLQGAHAAAHWLTSSPEISQLPRAEGTAAVLLTLLLVLCSASGALAEPVVFDKPVGVDPAVGAQRCTYYPESDRFLRLCGRVRFEKRHAFRIRRAFALTAEPFRQRRVDRA